MLKPTDVLFVLLFGLGIVRVEYGRTPNKSLATPRFVVRSLALSYKSSVSFVTGCRILCVVR